MTPQQLISATYCKRDVAEAWAPHLSAAMDEFNITSPLAKAAFIATTAHESARFTTQCENLNYSAEGLIQNFKKYFNVVTANQYARKPIMIANRVYANRMGNGDELSGDGWKYRGKGAIQVTGKDNHKACGEGLGIDLVGNPTLLLEFPNNARSAAWFFVNCGALKLAEKGDFDGVCDVVNRGKKTDAVGDSIGWADRLALWRLARTVF